MESSRLWLADGLTYAHQQGAMDFLPAVTFLGLLFTNVGGANKGSTRPNRSGPVPTGSRRRSATAVGSALSSHPRAGWFQQNNTETQSRDNLEEKPAMGNTTELWRSVFWRPWHSHIAVVGFFCCGRTKKKKGFLVPKTIISCQEKVNISTDKERSISSTSYCLNMANSSTASS